MKLNQDIFNNPQTLISENGDYDAIGGQITNFEYTLLEKMVVLIVSPKLYLWVHLYLKNQLIKVVISGSKISGNMQKSTPR